MKERVMYAGEQKTLKQLDELTNLIDIKVRSSQKKKEEENSNDIDNLKEEVERLREALEEYQRKEKCHESLREYVENTAKDKRSMKVIIHDLREEVSEKREEIRHLNTIVDDQNKTVDRYGDMANNHMWDAHILSQKNKVLLQTIGQCDDENSQLNSRLNEKQMELNDLRYKINEQEKENQAFSHLLNAKSSEITKRNHSISSLQGDLQSLEYNYKIKLSEWSHDYAALFEEKEEWRLHYEALLNQQNNPNIEFQPLHVTQVHVHQSYVPPFFPLPNRHSNDYYCPSNYYHNNGQEHFFGPLIAPSFDVNNDQNFDNRQSGHIVNVGNPNGVNSTGNMLNLLAPQNSNSLNKQRIQTQTSNDSTLSLGSNEPNIDINRLLQQQEDQDNNVSRPSMLEENKTQPRQGASLVSFYRSNDTSNQMIAEDIQTSETNSFVVN